MKIIKKTVVVQIPIIVRGTTKLAMRGALAEAKRSLNVSLTTMGDAGHATARTGRVSEIKEQQ